MLLPQQIAQLGLRVEQAAAGGVFISNLSLTRAPGDDSGRPAEPDSLETQSEAFSALLSSFPQAHATAYLLPPPAPLAPPQSPYPPYPPFPLAPLAVPPPPPPVSRPYWEAVSVRFQAQFDVNLRSDGMDEATLLSTLSTNFVNGAMSPRPTTA